jgi:GNAT superfamily N-acetyltransferase
MAIAVTADSQLVTMAGVLSLIPTAYDAPEIVALIQAYAAEVIDRETAAGRTLDMSQMAGTAADARSEQMSPPHGLFLAAAVDDHVVGCGGVRVQDGGLCEIKRMFVAPQARGQGIAKRLLAALEEAALEMGCHTAQLDTRSVLVEARTMYLAAGYVEVERYNDNPFAQHWFSKKLADA